MSDSINIKWFRPIPTILLVIAIWGISGLLLYNSENRGTFGDMFGAVNALFSGLAFAGVIFAILLQKQELSLQRKELELTRSELAGQKKEMALQNKTLLKQSFESTFFQLLRLQQEIVNSIDLQKVGNPGLITSGRDCMSVFYERFKKMWGENHEIFAGANEQERVNNTYLNFYKGAQSEIGHYFRSLYHIIKLVDQSSVNNKRLYTNLVRAQLSSFELTLLFYNCLSDLGNEKFKPLIEKYALLKNMPQDLLINPAEHLKLYIETAYK
jgi:hypothetical protein